MPGNRKINCWNTFKGKYFSCLNRKTSYIDYFSNNLSNRINTQKFLFQKYKNENITASIKRKHTHETVKFTESKLPEFVNDINENLPLYVLFKPEIIIKYKKILGITKKVKYSDKNWEKLSESINHVENCKYSLKYFKCYEDFMLFNSDIHSRNILEYKKKFRNICDDVFSENIHITFHGGEITPYVIYKKLKVKFDFYYIPLSMYNKIKTDIDLIKTVQILELLGPHEIRFDLHQKNKNTKNTSASLEAGAVNIGAGFGKKKNDKTDINQSTTYSERSGFYFNIDEFLKELNSNKEIFMSREDYDKDFELRYLIRSRINSFLETYTRTLSIRKLSSIENHMQLSLKRIYDGMGLSFKYNQERIEESSLTITCDFYSVHEIAILDDIPINHDGFKILEKRKDLKKEKLLNERSDCCDHNDDLNREIFKFIEKFMDKYELKFVHLEKLSNGTKDEKYCKLYYDVKSYNDIVNLCKYLQKDVEYTFLEPEGFDIIRHKKQEDYLTDIRIYLRRLLKSNNIEKEYDYFLRNYKTEESKDIFFLTLDKFEDLQKHITELLQDVRHTCINRKGFELLYANNIFDDISKRKAFLKRFIKDRSINKKYLELFDKCPNNMKSFFENYDALKHLQSHPKFYTSLEQQIERAIKFNQEEKRRRANPENFRYNLHFIDIDSDSDSDSEIETANLQKSEEEVESDSNNKSEEEVESDSNSNKSEEEIKFDSNKLEEETETDNNSNNKLEKETEINNIELKIENKETKI